MNRQVSFDFDSTLDKPSIQAFAKQLVNLGFDVWIVTTRLDNHQAPSTRWNDDLFMVANDVGIKLDNIHWTNGADKWIFLKTKNFEFHIDDDWYELKNIQKNIKGTKAISSFGNPKWKSKCIKALNMKMIDFK
jgi:hypothetical protein